MKKLLSALALFALMLVMPQSGYCWGAGDGTNYNQLQETAVFINNSGSTLTSGTVVVLDSTATKGSTLGAYMTTVASADVTYALGVVKSSSVPNGQSGVVVTRGPVQALYAGATGAITNAFDAMGTSSVAGQADSGTNLGVSLQADNTGKTADYDLLWIWVNPTNGD